MTHLHHQTCGVFCGNASPDLQLQLLSVAICFGGIRSLPHKVKSLLDRI